ncbi:MAG TPA: sugar phosphate isomerase/epimerase [Terriglobales bacterium]|nr:sugar phosphate isomerase/epimerase [Terriglobales bacterium]
MAAATRNLFGATKKPIGVQLYTVRDQAEKDLPGVLKGLQEIGYTQAEPYWNIYNHPAKELKQMLADHGLTAPSGHFDYEGLDTKFDYAQELGVTYMTCPMLPKPMWNSLDDFKKAADQFNKWGAEAQKRGMKFAFHNHNYEFKDLANRKGGDTPLPKGAPPIGYSILWHFTDPKLVWFEMDCYWITQAGLDPVKFLDIHGERIKMLHLKDRKPGFATSQSLDEAAMHFTEVGNGTLNWKAILAAAEKNKIEYMFVEEDYCDKPPMESLKISYNNLQKLLA